MSKAIGLFIAFTSIFLALQLGAGITAFIDVPSMMIVFGVSFGAIIARHDFVGFKRLFDEQKNQDVLKTFVDSSLVAAIIACIAAAVTLLTNMNGLKTIGPSLAVAMLSTLYATIIFVVCFVLNPKAKIQASSALLLLSALLTCSLFYIAGFIISLFMK